MKRSGTQTASVEALSSLYRQRYHRFLRVATAIVGDDDLAVDAVQEAFARALRGRFAFRGEGSLEGWIWRTLVNTARNVRRDEPPAHVSLDDVLGRAEAENGFHGGEGLRALVAALPERQRLVLFLRYYADLDYRAIAEALEIAPGTVGAALHAAHATIRRQLEEVQK